MRLGNMHYVILHLAPYLGCGYLSLQSHTFSAACDTCGHMAGLTRLNRQRTTTANHVRRKDHLFLLKLALQLPAEVLHSKEE